MTVKQLQHMVAEGLLTEENKDKYMKLKKAYNEASHRDPITRTRLEQQLKPVHDGILSILSTLNSKTTHIKETVDATQKDMAAVKDTLAKMTSGDIQPAGSFQNQRDELRHLRNQRQFVNNRIMKIHENAPAAKLQGVTSGSTQLREQLQAKRVEEKAQVAGERMQRKKDEAQRKFKEQVEKTYESKLADMQEQARNAEAAKKPLWTQAIGEIEAMKTDALKCRYTWKKGKKGERKDQTCEQLMCTKRKKQSFIELKISTLEASESD